MKRFTLRQILNSCNGEFFGDSSLLDKAVSSIVTDSRQVKESSLFVAVVGERVDGHDFAQQCFEKGAVCVLCEKKIDIPNGKTAILVKSTLQAIKEIAKAYRELFTIPFIGITGSVGKTSTKEMIAAALGESFCVLKTQGNFNNELGVPLTLFRLEDCHEVAVIEMGISDFGEMTRLTAMVEPDICVITNIGYCHLERLKDLDGVLKAKTEMFLSMQKNGKIFLNGDDEKLRTITDVSGIKPVFYGLDSRNDYYAADIVNNADEKLKCKICYDSVCLDTVIPALGNHMAANAACAFAIAKSLGMTDEKILNGIAKYKTVGSRSNVIKTDSFTIIDDCYNANPTSMRSSIDMLKNFTGRRVCILGDMKELGKNELALHLSTGEYAATSKIDLVIAIGEIAEKIAEGAKGKGAKAVHFDTVEKANDSLSSLLERGDVILVKASRAMKLENVVEKLKEL